MSSSDDDNDAGADFGASKEERESAERLALAHLRYQLANCSPASIERAEGTASGLGASAGSVAGATARLLAAVDKYEMGPWYASLCAEFGWDVDAARTAKLRAANAAELAKLEATIEDAEENHGDVEVMDALIAKAKFFDRIGDLAKMLATLDETQEKKASSGQKIDLVMVRVRGALFHADFDQVKGFLAQAAEKVEKGGDWDRRNRLKVYQGVFLLAKRDMKAASARLLDVVATFTSYELMAYNDFIFYAVVASVLALHDDRVQLKEKVVDASEILSVIRDIPHLEEFVNALYECRYADFFRAMVALEPRVATDRFLGPHAGYVVRELRVLAYKQFLESYRSVTIASMARSFGVSPAFIDSEVSRFIAAGRLSAKIDKTGEDARDANAGGVIETSRPDNRNAAYQAIVKEGDALLNRVQKLTRMINI